MSFITIMSRILPNYAVSIDSPFYRIGGDGFIAGELHRGIDFNYTDTGQNINGETLVYAPVSGSIVRTDATFFGEVTIERDDPNDPEADKTIHRILHLNTIETTIQAEGTEIEAGQLLGTMGGRSATRDPDTDQLIALGPNALPTHAHYEIYLPDANGWQAGDNRIDPVVYWSTGLELSSTAIQSVKDLTGSEQTTQGYAKEGELNLINVNINTPHTRDIAIRVQIKSDDPDFVATFSDEFIGFQQPFKVDDTNPNTAYFYIPATFNQTEPNTSFFFGITPPEDDNTSPEVITYSVDAGYLDSTGTWHSYSPNAGLLGPDLPLPGVTPNIIDPILDRTLIILDNDAPAASFGPTTTGTPTHDDSNYDINQDGDIPADRIDPIPDAGDYPNWNGSLIAQPDTVAIYGLGGNDKILGNANANILLTGGAGHDIIYGGSQAADGLDSRDTQIYVKKENVYKRAA